MKETKYFVKMNGVEILSLLSETTETFQHQDNVNSFYEISKSYFDTILSYSFSSYRDFMVFKIDELAGIVRSKYITTTPGQGETYLLKLMEAKIMTDHAFVYNNLPLEFPLLHNEMLVYGKTLEETVQDIITVKMNWSYLAAAIEKIRLLSKNQVLLANTKGECDAIFASASFDFQAY